MRAVPTTQSVESLVLPLPFLSAVALAKAEGERIEVRGIPTVNRIAPAKEDQTP
jgi:hypothetical protein